MTSEFCENTGSDSVSLRWNLRFFILNKLLCDADAAGPLYEALKDTPAKIKQLTYSNLFLMMCSSIAVMKNISSCFILTLYLKKI